LPCVLGPASAPHRVYDDPRSGPARAPSAQPLSRGLASTCSSDRETPQRQFLAGFVRAINRHLPLEPGREFGQSTLECDDRFVPEHLTRPGNIGETMPDISDPVATGDFRFDIAAVHHLAHALGDL